MKVIVFIILVFHIFNIEIFPGISLSNLALIITILALIFQLRHVNRVIISAQRRRSLIIIAILSFLIVMPILDVLTYINSNDSFERLTRSSIGWVGIGISIIFGIIFYRQVFLRSTIIYCAFVATLLSIIIFAISFRSLQNIDSVRFFMQDNLPLGINGYLFGIFFIQAAILTLPSTRTDGIQYKFITAIFIFLLTIGLLLGSRQYLISIVVLMLLWIVKSEFKIKRIIGLSLVCLLIIFPLLPLISESVTIRYELSLARIDNTKYDLRWINATELEQFLSAPKLFGYGFGYSGDYLARAVDIGHLEFFIDHGPIKYFYFIFLVYYLLRCGANFKFKDKLIKVTSRTDYIYYACVIAYVWYGFFNEILREYFIFIFIGALIGEKISQTKINIKNISRQTL